MIDYFIKHAYNPLSDIRVDLGTDEPLWKYVQKAIQDIEIINVLGLNPIDDDSVTPFIHVGNWTQNNLYIVNSISFIMDAIYLMNNRIAEYKDSDNKLSSL